MSINEHAAITLPVMLLLAACGGAQQPVGNAFQTVGASTTNEAIAGVQPPEGTAASQIAPGLQDRKTMQQDGQISLPLYDPRPVTMTAQTGGTLKLDGNCLVVSRANGSETDLPVFPRGTARWIAARQTLVFRDREYRIGDAISLGGGAMKASEPSLPAIDGMPSGCAREYVWLVG